MLWGRRHTNTISLDVSSEALTGQTGTFYEVCASSLGVDAFVRIYPTKLFQSKTALFITQEEKTGNNLTLIDRGLVMVNIYM